MRYFDNDMDELFKKAGQEYPLNTGKKDWNAVQKALATEEEAPAKAATGKNFKRFYPLLILLLLLPVLFYVLDNNADRSIAMRSAMKEKEEKSISGKNPADNGNKKPANNLDADRNNSKNNSANDINKADADNIIDNETKNSKNNQPNNIGDGQTNNIKSNRANNQNNNQPDDLNNSKSKNINKTEANNFNDSRANNPVNNQANKLNGNQPGNPALNNLNNNPLNDNVPNKNVSNNNLANENISQEKNLKGTLFPFELFNRNFAHPYASISEPQVKKEEPASAPQSAKKRPNKLYPSFYYGVMVGPDFSTIKYQDIKNIGSGVGLLLGYRFSQHWSVEASGFWSTKKYYTDGKYFNKANANIPWNVDLYFLDGGCQMVELPIDVRYQFTPGRNSFFLTAGLNSYFMKKESYDYKADASGSVYDGHRNYQNSGSTIFSNLQISGGYQHKLFSKFIVRIEPYLQVPLREVGIGKMPITSAGVHFGLVRETK